MQKAQKQKQQSEAITNKSVVIFEAIQKFNAEPNDENGEALAASIRKNLNVARVVFSNNDHGVSVLLDHWGRPSSNLVPIREIIFTIVVVKPER